MLESTSRALTPIMSTNGIEQVTDRCRLPYCLLGHVLRLMHEPKGISMMFVVIVGKRATENTTLLLSNMQNVRTKIS